MWVTPNARATCKNEGGIPYQLGNNYDNLVITGLITLKLRMDVGSYLAMYFHVSQLGC